MEKLNNEGKKYRKKRIFGTRKGFDEGEIIMQINGWCGVDVILSEYENGGLRIF
jgi:hypothetical protein